MTTYDRYLSKVNIPSNYFKIIQNQQDKVKIAYEILMRKITSVEAK
jgi:hypothetical protein